VHCENKKRSVEQSEIAFSVIATTGLPRERERARSHSAKVRSRADKLGKAGRKGWTECKLLCTHCVVVCVARRRSKATQADVERKGRRAGVGFVRNG